VPCRAGAEKNITTILCRAVPCRASARKFEVCRAGADKKIGKISIPALQRKELAVSERRSQQLPSYGRQSRLGELTSLNYLHKKTKVKRRTRARPMSSAHSPRFSSLISPDFDATIPNLGIKKTWLLSS